MTFIGQGIGLFLVIDIIDGLVVHVHDILFPSGLYQVDLCHDGTDALEIFLTGIAEGDSTCHSTQLFLGYLRHKTYRTQHITCADTNG